MSPTRRDAFKTLAGGALAAAPRYRIIDPHVHVWKRDPRYPFAPETTKPPDRDATPEMLLELMRANGVERTVIIQVIYYRWDNRYLADTLKKYPREFRGVARVDPESPRAPDDLSRLVEEQGWSRCRQLKVPMTVLAPVTRMPDVALLVEKFPDLTVVIDHMADSPLDQPRELEKLLALARYPLVFVKVSHTWSLSREAYPYADAQAQVKRLYDAFGPKRLMWGTDWPLVEAHCGYAKALELVRDRMSFLNEEDKRWMLGRTVERVWPFGA
jgi:predicted TIM-barrel fold metal-dependent hydrolase